MKKMAGYCRVSTPKQVEEGESLDVQAKRLKAEAQRRGWVLTLYVEAGISAKDANRPAYQKMRSDLEAGTVEGAVAIKLDRFWRSLPLAVSEIDVLVTQWGRDLMTLDGMLDYATPEKRLTTNIMAALAQWQREQQAERVKDSMVHRAEAGKFNGGRVALGYRSLKNGGLAIQEEEAAQVREMFQLCLAKGTTYGVCDTINKAGWRTRANKPWDLGSVRKILMNPIYVGDLVYGRRHKGEPGPPSEHIRKAGVFPAIVSRETFEAVQQVRADIKATFAPRSQRSPYLLSGLVWCHHCGGRMHGHRNERWHYYKCAAAVHKGSSACPNQTCIRSDKLEDAVVEGLFHFRIDPNQLRALLSDTNEERRTELPGLRQRIGHLEGRLTELSGRQERMKDAYEDGHYDLAELKRRAALTTQKAKEVESALAQARAELQTVETETTDVECVICCLEHLHDVYVEIDFPAQQQMLRGVLDRVVVKDQHGGFFTVQHLDKLVEGKMGEYPIKVTQKPKTKITVKPEIKRFLLERSGEDGEGSAFAAER